MPLHPLAGKPAPREILVNIPRLITEYFTCKPDVGRPDQEVSFGTSGHRGSSFKTSYNEDHILAVTQAICDYPGSPPHQRSPVLGRVDTHALSEPSQDTALEVLGANEVPVRIARDRGSTPTPVISQAVLTYNRGRSRAWADGIVITPSHNPPGDGGIKYTPPRGTGGNGSHPLDRGPGQRPAAQGPPPDQAAFPRPGRPGRLIRGIRLHHPVRGRPAADHRYGSHPPGRAADRRGSAAGGSSVAYWDPIAQRYGLSLDLVNRRSIPPFLL